MLDLLNSQSSTFYSNAYKKIVGMDSSRDADGEPGKSVGQTDGIKFSQPNEQRLCERLAVSEEHVSA